MKLTVLIPCYNEEDRLLPTLVSIDTFLKKTKEIQGNILIIDDGSSDETVKKAKAAKVKTPLRIVKQKKNQGKGAAIIRGVQETKTPWVLFTDADLSTPIREVKKFLKATKKHDIVIASRNLPESVIPVRQPLLRSILGKGFAKVVPSILGLSHKDTQCGFKLMKTERAKQIISYMQITGWAFDAEMLFLAKQFNIPVIELPVTWSNSDQSKVDPIRAPIQMLKDVVGIRYHWLRGNYEKRR